MPFEVLKETNLTCIGPKLGGSNPAGQYEHNSTQYYVKFPHRRPWNGEEGLNNSPGSLTYGEKFGNFAVLSEFLAAELYRLGNINVPELSLVEPADDKNCYAIASKMEKFTEYKDLSKPDQDKVKDGTIPGLAEGFAFDVWLGNWDVIGLYQDNIGVVTDANGNKRVMRIDVGGSLEARACGLKKGGDGSGLKDDPADEIVILKNKPIFSHLKNEDICSGVQKIVKISDETLTKMVNAHAPGDSEDKQRLLYPFHFNLRCKTSYSI